MAAHLREVTGSGQAATDGAEHDQGGGGSRDGAGALRSVQVEATADGGYRERAKCRASEPTDRGHRQRAFLERVKVGGGRPGGGATHPGEGGEPLGGIDRERGRDRDERRRGGVRE